MKKRYLLTGANGLVGTHVKTELESRGHEVISLVRKATAHGEIEYKLGRPLDRVAFEGADALIHAAYDFNAFTWDEIYRSNVEGSIALFKAARDAGVRRLIFISTISAFNGCRSLYGQGKLEVERCVTSLGGVNVRPGLVYDGSDKGMFGALTRIARLPLLPVFAGGRQLFYMSHADDLARLLAILAETDDLSDSSFNLITAASNEGISFRNLLHALANRAGKKPLFVSVPACIGLFGLRALEALGLRIGFKSDSLISMVYPNSSPDFSALPRLHASFRRFELTSLTGQR